MRFPFVVAHFIYTVYLFIAPRNKTPAPSLQTLTNLIHRLWKLAYSRSTSTLWRSRDSSRCAVSSLRRSTVSSRIANVRESPDKRERRRRTLSKKSSLNWSRKIKIWDLRSSILSLTNLTSTLQWAASKLTPLTITRHLLARCIVNHSLPRGALRQSFRPTPSPRPSVTTISSWITRMKSLKIYQMLPTCSRRILTLLTNSIPPTTQRTNSLFLLNYPSPLSSLQSRVSSHKRSQPHRSTVLTILKSSVPLSWVSASHCCPRKRLLMCSLCHHSQAPVSLPSPINHNHSLLCVSPTKFRGRPISEPWVAWAAWDAVTSFGGAYPPFSTQIQTVVRK